ncbi:MAG: hypothetical protein H7X93_13840 [Sphingomonadaceae bacterium]|nr:hypothetical protein [Sphingomonadaceae bacterium]
MEPKQIMVQAFATPVFTWQFADRAELNARVAESVRRLARAGRSHDENRAHQGGFYTPGALFDDPPPEIVEVRSLMRDGVRRYMEVVARTGYGRIRAIPDGWIHLQGWAALTRERDYQPPHVHAGSNMSCIYYVEVPDKPDPQGAIDLMNPLPAQEMTFIPGGQTTHCRVTPRPGMLLIFPAYVSHIVHPFFGAGERICIVANAMIKPPA